MLKMSLIDNPKELLELIKEIESKKWSFFCDQLDSALKVLDDELGCSDKKRESLDWEAIIAWFSVFTIAPLTVPVTRAKIIRYFLEIDI
jgi:hypothetical protein